MFVNVMLLSCCLSLISADSCLGSHEESLLNDIKSDIQKLETRLKAKSLRCPVGWKEFAHHCYNFITTKLPWNEAEWACRKLGGYLVKVNDETENNWLKQQAIGVNDHIWLGAADFTEGDWIWVVDFSNVTYTDWRSGQPSNWGGKEDCMHLDKPFRYEWNDAPCSSHMSYICEIEKGGARIPYSKPFPR
ncbi:perlucin-like protein [Mytilus galloprovincialis]|uniref:perlucin-like protein n=1 Tax=Mytilus galloprovincialis TaxID=29158 RepID=UPI003F7BA131